MKKFLREFKEFISKGNVLDLAVGVIIGSAFSTVVTALTDYIIQPLINCIGGAEVAGKIHLIGDNYIDYGAFLSSIINFVIMAFVIFCIVKTVNKAVEFSSEKLHINDEEPAEPTTKICPYCKSEVSIEAVKCAHCTSDLPAEE